MPAIISVITNDEKKTPFSTAFMQNRQHFFGDRLVRNYSRRVFFASQTGYVKAGAKDQSLGFGHAPLGSSELLAGVSDGRRAMDGPEQQETR